MPVWNMGEGFTFKYGKTWTVRDTDQPAIVRLIPGPQAQRADASDRWWVVLATGDSSQEVWGKLRTLPEQAGAVITGVKRQFGGDLDGLRNRDRVVQRALFDGVCGEDPVQVWVIAELFREEGNDVRGLAAVGVGGPAEIEYRFQSVFRRFSCRFAPHDGRFSEELKRQSRESAPRRDEARQARVRAPHPPPPQPTQPPPSSRPGGRAPVLHERQCGQCSGTGTVTCSSCHGMGSYTTTSTQTDWEGNIEYLTDHVPCAGCSGGRMSCPSCFGRGRVRV